MSLQIVYGRSGTGKTNYIFQEISRNINNGRKKYIITPEQFSFSAEKELLKSLEAQGSAVINAEVLTFARMAHRVSGEVGGSNKTVLSNCGKSMLIYSILANKKNLERILSKRIYEEEKEEKCTICCEIIKKGNCVTLLNCNHIFHYQCI